VFLSRRSAGSWRCWVWSACLNRAQHRPPFGVLIVKHHRSWPSWRCCCTPLLPIICNIAGIQRVPVVVEAARGLGLTGSCVSCRWSLPAFTWSASASHTVINVCGHRWRPTWCVLGEFIFGNGFLNNPVMIPVWALPAVGLAAGHALLAACKTELRSAGGASHWCRCYRRAAILVAPRRRASCRSGSAPSLSPRAARPHQSPWPHAPARWCWSSRWCTRPARHADVDVIDRLPTDGRIRLWFISVLHDDHAYSRPTAVPVVRLPRCASTPS
jgi:hypothetical protein